MSFEEYLESLVGKDPEELWQDDTLEFIGASRSLRYDGATDNFFVYRHKDYNRLVEVSYVGHTLDGPETIRHAGGAIRKGGS